MSKNDINGLSEKELLTLLHIKNMYIEKNIVKQDVIALIMGVSQRTIAKHVANIYSKLHVKDKSDLLVKLALAGELNPVNDPYFNNNHNNIGKLDRRKAA